MNTVDQVQALLTELGKRIELPDLTLDEDGYAAIGVDGKYLVHVQADARGGNLVLFSEIGHLPEDRAGELALKLLEANLFWKDTGGGTLALEPGSRAVVLAYQEAAGPMEYARFEQLLQGFTNAVEHWTTTFSDWQNGGADPSDAPSSDAAGGMAGIRV